MGRWEEVGWGGVGVRSQGGKETETERAAGNTVRTVGRFKAKLT